jgi:hypothetical protein
MENTKTGETIDERALVCECFEDTLINATEALKDLRRCVPKDIRSSIPMFVVVPRFPSGTGE